LRDSTALFGATRIGFACYIAIAPTNSLTAPFRHGILRFMRLHFSRPIRLLLSCVVVILTCGGFAAAQEPDFDDLAKSLSKQISKAGIKSVVVAEFVNKEGEASPAGHYLAGEFSQGLDKHKKNFVVTDRGQPTDAAVTGTLETTPAQYSLEITVRSVKDGGLLGSGQQSIKRPAIADGMILLASKALPEQLAVAGQDGVGIPTCEYCPPPLYSDEARKAGLQGSVLLVVIVNSEGRAGRTAVTKTPDASLAKQATDTVKNWRFNPATDKGGKPVSVLVPIEVTFRFH
jgi:TonB family protein